MSSMKDFLLKTAFHLLIAAGVGYWQSSLFLGIGLFVVLIFCHWALGILIDWEDRQPGDWLNPTDKNNLK